MQTLNFTHLTNYPNETIGVVLRSLETSKIQKNWKSTKIQKEDHCNRMERIFPQTAMGNKRYKILHATYM